MINIFFKTLMCFALSLFCSNFASSSTTLLEEIINSVISLGMAPSIDPSMVDEALKEIPEDQDLTLGYIALCEGTYIPSDALELCSLSKWSHVAMILCDPKDIVFTEQQLSKKADKTKWYCFQAEVNQVGSGMQLIPWSTFEKIEKDVAAISLRPFTYGYGSIPTMEKLQDVINPLIGEPYEKLVAEFVASSFRANTKANETSLFCSELVAVVLQRLNILTSDPSSPNFRLSNNFSPADFSTEHPSSLQLIDANLGNELRAWPFSKTVPRRAFDFFVNTLSSVTQRCTIM